MQLHALHKHDATVRLQFRVGKQVITAVQQLQNEAEHTVIGDQRSGAS